MKCMLALFLALGVIEGALSAPNNAAKPPKIFERSRSLAQAAPAGPAPLSLDKADLLPSGAIYSAPCADPRWPKFSVGYQRHFKNHHGQSIFSLSFGENIALVRYKTPKALCEWGVQAGLFGLMDISKSPSTLINADYFIGLGWSFMMHNQWQNLLQLSHTSSHLGDELILNKTAPRRVNLSYEVLKWFTAYKLGSFRPYIGLGYLLHRDPSSIRRLTLEIGCDYVSKEKFLFQTAHYVVGFHAHSWEANHFKPGLNLCTGLQFQTKGFQGRNLSFLLDYSHGKSRHGQFYQNNEHYLGFIISLSS